MPTAYRSAIVYRRQLMSYRGVLVQIRQGRRTARPETTSHSRTITPAGLDRSITAAGHDRTISDA